MTAKTVNVEVITGALVRWGKKNSQAIQAVGFGTGFDLMVTDSDLLIPMTPLYWYWWPQELAVVRENGPDRYIAVIPQLYSWAIVAGPRPHNGAHDDKWEYPDLVTAVSAASMWDETTDPDDGWVRHPRDNRRRPDGDPAKEEVRP